MGAPRGRRPQPGHRAEPRLLRAPRGGGPEEARLPRGRRPQPGHRAEPRLLRAPPTSASPTSRPAASSPAARSAAARTAAPRPARTARPAGSGKPAAPKGGSGSGSSGFSSGYPTGADARGAVKAAVAAAKADGKKVLIDFGANWCGNCKAADKVFATSEVGALLDASYHVVKVDIGSQDSGAFDLLRDYCSGEGAYKMPVLVVLDGNGNVVTETHSTGNPDLTAAGLGAFLRKWA
ncbi:thioredoxin family protein [Streptomyces sp. ms191]|nr:thioredoxin family protein [Streptomyces sp. ms191]